MKTKLSPRFLCAVTLFSLIGQVAWVVENMYFNVFIYKMFNASPENISAMVAASAVAATLTTVFMGAVSDKVGKRKLFICAGYLLWGVSILSFVFLRKNILGTFLPATVSVASAGVSLVIILDCIMTFFGSTANDAAFNAWVTDSTDNTNRGSVEGINAMMPLVAILAVFGGFMFFNLDNENSWTIIFLIIGGIVFIVGLLGFFLIKDSNTVPAKEGLFTCILYGFRPSTARKSPLLYLSLICFAIFNISIQIFMPYLIIYYEKTLNMTDYVLIMAPAIILAAVFTFFWGKVYDKKGFGFSVSFPIISLCAGYLLLFFTRTTLPVFVGSLMMMCGYLSSMAVFGAMIRDNTPENKAGMFQGLRIFSQVLIPGVVGPAIGAAVLQNAETIINNDGTESFLPSANIFLAALLVIAVLVPLLIVCLKIKKPTLAELSTPFEDEINEIPWAEYPRPTLKRESYINLNGEWTLEVKRGRKTVKEDTVLVPYPPESRISGFGFLKRRKDILIYSKNVNFCMQKGRLMLHFGAVDQICEVFVNRKSAGGHVGGYLPFTLDVTDLIVDGENLLEVVVADRLDRDLAWGKQCYKRGGMWYTPISGIWQTVWAEWVPENYIEGVVITPDLNGISLELNGGCERNTLIFEDKEYVFEGRKFRLEVENPEHWTPENPKLYEFTLQSGEDRVQSYFALRTVEVKDDKILLNGKPYFFHGLLDQGYFSDGIYTPATPRGLENDILTCKELGFNMLRKHIKIEPELFYYYCDKYGMAVFQDLVNSGGYSFIIDTALPTIGLKRGISHRASAKRREAFKRDARDTLTLLYNHPSVCYYTLFNEGWGQFDAENMYAFVKGIDSTRVWDATSGWFWTGKSDVKSEHIYFKPIKLKNDGSPLVLSEFGGYSCKIEGHSFNLDKTYGYRFFTDTEKFKKALSELYLNEVVGAIKEQGLCATVLTQVSDVEDETNGLMTYDRRVLKADAEEMRKIAETLYREYADYCSKQG